jgi:RNA polymerase sigma-70 factor (ECF subfamily)
MGTLQASFPDVLRPVRVSSDHRSDGAITPSAISKEWAVVQQAIAGNADAQQCLFTCHKSRLYRDAFALLRNKEDAEDAVQDGLCKAFVNLRSFRGRSSFSTWLTRVVMNAALVILRKRRTRPETSLDEMLESQSDWLGRGEVNEPRLDPETIFSAKEINAHVEEHVGQLRPTLRTAFRLGVVSGLSTRESSQALGISVGAFKSRIFCARRTVVYGVQQRLRCARGY